MQRFGKIPDTLLALSKCSLSLFESEDKGIFLFYLRKPAGLPWHTHLPTLLPHFLFSFIKRGKKPRFSEGDGEEFESKSSNPTWCVSPFLLGSYNCYCWYHPATLRSISSSPSSDFKLLISMDILITQL